MVSQLLQQKFVYNFASMTLVNQKVRTHCAGDKVARQSGRENFASNWLVFCQRGSETRLLVQNHVSGAKYGEEQGARARRWQQTSPRNSLLASNGKYRVGQTNYSEGEPLGAGGCEHPLVIVWCNIPSIMPSSHFVFRVGSTIRRI